MVPLHLFLSPLAGRPNDLYFDVFGGHLGYLIQDLRLGSVSGKMADGRRRKNNKAESFKPQNVFFEAYRELVNVLLC